MIADLRPQGLGGRAPNGETCYRFVAIARLRWVVGDGCRTGMNLRFLNTPLNAGSGSPQWDGGLVSRFDRQQ
ncbi:MAG UNVERIFIED_CONTAM: hypothetical protein LVT10_09565, partial [Anaerolineae bacterium]